MKSPLTPEQLREQRLEREQRSTVDRAEKATSERLQASSVLAIGGLIMMIVGAYFIVANPFGDEVMGREIVNLHGVFIGQTAALIGAIFFACGIHLRHR